MNWIRIGLFTALTLMAATLPAGAQSSPPTDEPAVRPSDDATAAKTDTAKTDTAKTDTAKTDARNSQDKPADSRRPADGLILQAAPAPEVWKTASPRPLDGNGTLVWAGNARNACEQEFGVAPRRATTVETFVRPNDAKAWLSCRYPHAPPA